MESVGAIYEGEWSNLNGMYSNEEADFMAHLLGNCSIPNEVPTNISTTNFEFFSSWPNQENHDGPIYNYSSEETSAGDQMYSFSQGSSFCVPPMTGNLGFTNYIGMEAGDEFLKQDLSNDSMESSGGDLAGTAPLQLGRDRQQEDKEYETSKKRPRIPLDVKNKRIVKPKKNQEKVNSTDKNDENSEDDSIELNEESKETKSALNLKGKTRASRGSATDPQSLYARKRRERINERLRILQNLVPNGTKVDISTMLEEAVQYVKFLQIQIKLLSSNDMWMYAPIAYNGMDIGLDLKRFD